MDSLSSFGQSMNSVCVAHEIRRCFYEQSSTSTVGYLRAMDDGVLWWALFVLVKVAASEDR